MKRSCKPGNCILIGLNILLVLVLVAEIVGGAYLIRLQQELDLQVPSTPSSGTGSSSESTVTQPTQPTVTEPSVPTEPPVQTVGSATISAVGDVMMHLPVVYAGLRGGRYNYDSMFSYLKPYVQKADYAAANLETTLAGLKAGESYTGYPDFNSPDAILDALKKSGFDLILTANNHNYDTGTDGLYRTQEEILERDLHKLGTKLSDMEPNYRIVEINGIRIGMVCYSYENDSGANRKTMGDDVVAKADMDLINSFDYHHLGKFYEEMQLNMALMKAEGVDAVVAFLHWGTENALNSSSRQRTIAQNLCNLGVDVIVGSHPHVVQPVELYSSAYDAGHKMVCIYSLGNVLSNQRREEAGIPNSGHTEDGALCNLTFTKYPDGTVLLTDVEMLPLWVHYYKQSGRKYYRILPLDAAVPDWKSAYNLSDEILKETIHSWTRTHAIIDSGLEKVDAYLDSVRQQVEDRIRSEYPLTEGET